MEAIHNSHTTALERGLQLLLWGLMERLFLALGASLAFLGVAAGAFGAHGLRDRLATDLLEVFEIAVRYQMYHSLALLAVALAMGRIGPSTSLIWAGWFFLAGILIFSGSLYLLSLTGIRWLGAITPIGGVALLAGWFCLAWSALASK